ncbi:MAG: hypothetical protein HOH19_15090 [Kordiimonadaceae bacterium]|nr:hypothetical protein [Kordiimonadaceae bacterium]
MKLLELDFYLDNIRILGVIAIIIGMGAWVMDWMDWVYVCPFCRVQRTSIALLGLFMTLPHTKHFIIRYITCIFGFFGTAVAGAQHFLGWVSIQKGEKTGLSEQWWLDSWLLSFFAICIIIAQVWLIFLNKNEAK